MLQETDIVILAGPGFDADLQKSLIFPRRGSGCLLEQFPCDVLVMFTEGESVFKIMTGQTFFMGACCHAGSKVAPRDIPAVF